MNDDTPEAEKPLLAHTIDLVFWLPCGCTLRNGVRFDLQRARDTFGYQPENHPRYLESGFRSLGYWLAQAARRHRCDLVTVENPNGITSQETPHG